MAALPICSLYTPDPRSMRGAEQHSALLKGPAAFCISQPGIPRMGLLSMQL